MKTKNKLILIQIAYGVILAFALLTQFKDMKKGYIEGYNAGHNIDSMVFTTIDFIKGLLVVVGSIMCLYILFHLYNFINSVKKGKIFKQENIRRLVIMGWQCIILPFLFYGFYFMETHAYVGKSSIYEMLVSVTFDFWLLLFGITLLTIGFVFQKGIELQQEQDLTI